MEIQDQNDWESDSISRESQLWSIIETLVTARNTPLEERRKLYQELPVMWRVDDTKKATKNIMWASSAQEIPGWNWTTPSPFLTKPTQ